MPLFASEEELQKLGDDLPAIVARADEYARGLIAQVETHKARADAAAIDADRTCSLLEQKFVAAMEQASRLESEKAAVATMLEAKSAELAEARGQVHQVEMRLMKRDADFEAQAFEIKELHTAKKEMLDVIALKNSEIDEKNASMRTYLDKVLALTEERSRLEGRAHQLESDLVNARTHEARMEQEKDITAQHNTWLNQELSSKVSFLLEERQKNAELESALQLKILEAERATREKEESVTRIDDSLKAVETKLQEYILELKFVKEDAAAKEEHLTTEVATASRLADLYKQSSEEWSRKSSELEGVIKAIEAHLNEVRAEYELKLQKETDLRHTLEKEVTDAKQALEQKDSELQNLKSESHGIIPVDDRQLALLDSNNGTPESDRLPLQVSGTALAVSLLRDGWSLASLYSKYQEATDALRHERQERTHCQNLLNRVLKEIEEKAELILAERDEYRRMVESYKVMQENLRLSIADQAVLENTIRELKAEIKKKTRHANLAQKEVSDLQYEIAVLLKECSDVRRLQGHPGGGSQHNDSLQLSASPVPDSTSAEAIISERLVVFKDIQELIETNTKLRMALREVSAESERKEQQLKEEFEAQLARHINEASVKVSKVLQQAEEQNQMIESLQGTVAMYKRLYDEERQRSLVPVHVGADRVDLGDDRHDVRKLMDAAEEQSRRELKKTTQQIASLEEELTKARHEVISTRADCARMQAETSSAKEQLSSVLRESEIQRKQTESILLRNMELSQTILDLQRRLRETSQNLQAAEEQARKSAIEVSIMEREKELLVSAEKRVAEEASQLSERVQRLQASLATIEGAEEVREVSRMSEKKKLEEEVSHLQREWVDAKRQLELERNHMRKMTDDHDKAISQASERIEALTRELKSAATAASASEIRAKVAETRCNELELNLKKADDQIMAVLSGGKTISRPDDSNAEVLSSLHQSREEILGLKEELAAARAHAEQYKHIAMASGEALKEIQAAHDRLKAEAASTKVVLDSELKELQQQLSHVEAQSVEKEKEAGAMQANKESLLRDALKELALLKDEIASKQASVEHRDEQIKTLKEELDKEHRQWREAQSNYERQVLLQADTIRELSLANERLEKLQEQEKKLLERAENAEAEMASVKVSFYMEKAAWDADKASMDKQMKELNGQNSVLLNRLELKHVAVAEQERKAVGDESGAAASKDEVELQNIICYLRRSKEAADTEISLLKQERLRLTRQFEAASRAAEEAQAKLRQQQESVRESLYSDEEFMALKSQVMELNLLRESTAQLRDENRKILDDNKDLKEKLSNLEAQQESWKKIAREKQLELESASSEIEFLKAEVQRWQQRLSQILEKYKALDVDDYERVKALLAGNEERVKTLQEELEALKREAATMAEANKRLEQSEASLTERNKRYLATLKRHAKEKEELSKRNEELKTIMDKKYETVHQEAVEAAQRENAALYEVQKELSARTEQTQKENVARLEQAQKDLDQRLKEKESRIQTLEKTLNNERELLKTQGEELRKEKQGREKDRKAWMEAHKHNKEKTHQLQMQLQQAQAAGNISDLYSKATAGSDQPEAASRDAPEAATTTATSMDVVPAVSDAPLTTTLAVRPPQVALTRKLPDPEKQQRDIQELKERIEQRERNRKPARPRLIRPRIEQASQPDSTTEMEAAGEGASEAEGGTLSNVLDVNGASLKRTAAEPIDSSLQHGDASVPPTKKPKTSEAEAESRMEAPEISGGGDEQQTVEGGDSGLQRRVRFLRPETVQQRQQQQEGESHEKSPEPQVEAAEDSMVETGIDNDEIPKSPVHVDGQDTVMVTDQEDEEAGDNNNTDVGEAAENPEDGEISFGDGDAEGDPQENEKENNDLKEEAEQQMEAEEQQQLQAGSQSAATTVATGAGDTAPDTSLGGEENRSVGGTDSSEFATALASMSSSTAAMINQVVATTPLQATTVTTLVRTAPSLVAPPAAITSDPVLPPPAAAALPVAAVAPPVVVPVPATATAAVSAPVSAPSASATASPSAPATASPSAPATAPSAPGTAPSAPATAPSAPATPPSASATTPPAPATTPSAPATTPSAPATTPSVPVTSTKVNIAERAAARSLVRRSTAGLSPPSPGASQRGRGRANVRGGAKGRRGARGGGGGTNSPAGGGGGGNTGGGNSAA